MRYVTKLYNSFQTYQKLFDENDIKIDSEMIDGFYIEFCQSKSLRQYSKDSEKFFDYLINRLHLLLLLNMFDIMLPLTYKGYKAAYKYDSELKLYIGNVVGEHDTYLENEKFEDFKENFQNTIDYVVKMR